MKHLKRTGVWILAIVLAGGSFSPHVSAQMFPAGSLFTCESGSAVYFLSSEGKRYVFPNEATYFSWYDDFDSVFALPDASCAQWTLAGNVTARPGRILIKLPSLNELYAVSTPNVLHHITTESLAQSLYGDRWNDPGPEGYVREISDVFFKNYTVGDPITNSFEFDRSIAEASCEDFNACLGLDAVADPAPQPNPQPQLGVTDPYARYAIAHLSKPPLGQGVLDPNFGSIIRRLSEGVSEHHLGARLQSVNASSTRMLLKRSDGVYVVRRMIDGALVATLGPLIAPRWNPANADEILFFDPNDTGNGATIKVQKYTLSTSLVSDVYELPSTYEFVVESPSFQELSRDGRWMAAYVNHRSTDADQSIVAIDLQSKQIGARLSMNNLRDACDAEVGDVFSVIPSPLGKYLVVQWENEGETGTRIERCTGTEVFDIETGMYAGHISNHHHAADMGLDELGREVYVTSEFGNSHLLSLTLLPGSDGFKDGYERIILDAGYGHLSRISCQGPAGVCVVSGSKNGGGAFAEEAYLVYMNGQAADNRQNDQASVRRLAHHRSTQCHPDHEAQATMSRDGQFVVFASDWGDCRGSVESYAVTLPQGLTAP